MYDSVVAGQTSYITEIMIYDSSSNVGAGLTGLTYNAANLVVYHKRSANSASVQITMANVTTLGTYAGNATQGALREVDATNMPGVYEFHINNNAFATGSNNVMITLEKAANMVPVSLYFRINPPSDLQTILGTAVSTPATAGVLDVNLKNIANVAVSNTTPQLGVNVLQFAGTNTTARDLGASVLLSPGTGTGQIQLATGNVTVGTVGDKTAYQLAANQVVLISNGTANGQLTQSAGTVTVGTNNDKAGYTAATVTDKTGYSLAVNQVVLVSNGTANGQLTQAAGTVTVGTNNDKTGYTASTVSDKAGYSLAANQVVLVSNGTANGQLNQNAGNVTLSVGTGAGQIQLTSGNVTVGTIDKTGYSLAVNQVVLVSNGTANGQISTAAGLVQLAANQVVDQASIGTTVWGQLNTAYSDATSLNATSLLERLRVLGWIIRNQVTVNDSTGTTTIYKDDNVTQAYNVANALTDTSGNTTRLRMA